MQIAVFGGAFDPPHVGHYQIAQFLLDSKICEEVWFLPVAEHAFGKKLTDSKHRINMLEMLINKHPQMKIEAYELTKTEGVNQTYQTMVALSRENPRNSLSFVMGSDNLAKFHTWGQYQKLHTEFPIYVYPRLGFPFSPVYPGMITLTKAPIVATSSTEVRNAIKKGNAVVSLVTPGVAQYIKDHNVYAIAA